MTAMQFDAEVHEGVLSLPVEARKAFEGRVHVIVMKDEAPTDDDFIAELLDSPVEAGEFRPLSRDEANER